MQTTLLPSLIVEIAFLRSRCGWLHSTRFVKEEHFGHQLVLSPVGEHQNFSFPPPPLRIMCGVVYQIAERHWCTRWFKEAAHKRLFTCV